MAQHLQPRALESCVLKQLFWALTALCLSAGNRLKKCLLQSARNLQGLYSAWSQVLSVLLEIEGELMGSKAQPSFRLPQQPTGLAPRMTQSGKVRGVCLAI